MHCGIADWYYHIGGMLIVLHSFGCRNYVMPMLLNGSILYTWQMVCLPRPQRCRWRLNAESVTEVAQQSKARRKDDFLIAFSPVSYSKPQMLPCWLAPRSSLMPPPRRTKELPTRFSKSWGEWWKYGDSDKSLKPPFRRPLRDELKVCGHG